MASPQLLKGRTSERDAYYVITTVVQGRVPWIGRPQLAGVVIAELNRCAEEHRVKNEAWVVMPDHVHWLFQLQDERLSRCIQAFKSRSARSINTHIGRSKAFWQPGFYDHRLRDDEDLRLKAQYIVANPLRKGLVDRLEDFPHAWCRWPVATP